MCKEEGEKENCSLSALLLFFHSDKQMTCLLSFHFKINRTFQNKRPISKQGTTLACIYCIALHHIMYTEHIMIEELTIEEFKMMCIRYPL